MKLAIGSSLVLLVTLYARFATTANACRHRLTQVNAARGIMAQNVFEIRGVTIMDMTLKSKILDVFAGCKDLTIATIREDGHPQATVVSYANDGLAIYFGCGEQSQKAKNLARNNKVSLTITRDYKNWDEIKGVSVAGIAERVTDPQEIARIARLMLMKFPEILKHLPENVTGIADITGTVFFRVTLRIVSVLDYSQGFGHNDLVTMP
jgi:nitroimidazol reductase NimA-like FMN-containing flavoprotein (pyridoxamine 5'-phosphate oxidase superfamily)